MASVTPRRTRAGDVSWRVQYRVDGRLRQETFTTEKAAREFGRLVDRVGGSAARQVRLARTSEETAAPTLRDWTATYLNLGNGHLAGVTPGTAESYRLIAERAWLVTLGDMPLDAITEQHVAQWVHWQERQANQRTGSTVAGKTVKNYHALLSQTLAAAVAARLIDRNVARGAKLTRTVREEMVCLTPAEFAAVYAELPNWALPLTAFLIATGARWGEATAVRWRAFRADGILPYVRITEAWKRGEGSSPVLGPPKTRKAVRSISLDPASLAAFGPRGQAGDLAFPHPTGAGQRAWSARFHDLAWRPAVQRSGIAVSPRVHDIRHSHASWQLARGVPLHELQQRLGHESIQTTVGTYGHLMPEAQMRMADAAAQGIAEFMAHLPVALMAQPTALDMDPWRFVHD